jgi:hypothetical protein
MRDVSMNARSLTVTASDSSPRGRVLLAALLALALVCATALAGPAPAQAAECPNETLRAEARSTQLPQCRAYELVSPVDTQDSAVGLFGAAPNGEAAEFGSVGVFAGARSDNDINDYVARRVENVGWQTSAVSIPAALGGQTSGVSTSFDLAKQLVRFFDLSGETPNTCGMLLSEDLLAAPALSYAELADYPSRGEKLSAQSCAPAQDESPNFAEVVFYLGSGLYGVSGAGGPAEALLPVSVNTAGETIQAVVGRGEQTGGSLFHAISNDGAEIFFTEGEKGTGGSYVRVNGSRTLKLSGRFQGASEDGSKVFLSGAGEELYMDVIDSEPGHVTAKVLLTPGAAGTYLRSSDDGSHLYFDSKGVFAGNENENKEKAEAEKENLYVYEPDPEHPGGYRTVFIARARPGSNSEGRIEAQVNGCPSTELKETEEPGCEAGRFFVFATAAKITPDDTGSAQQVFEYDARTGRLARVSLGEDGYDENGNGGAGDATIAAPNFDASDHLTQTDLFEENTRAVSDDGSTVLFSTARALSPRAGNDLPQPGPKDIYEYHEGQVSLISTGHSSTSDEEPVITHSGRDIFFTSTENILPQKSDGLKGLWDARIEGGFPAALVPAGGCNGDACQGPPSVLNLLAAPASATFSGLGNPTPPAPTPAVKPGPKAKPKTCRKGYVKKRGKCVKKSKPKKKATKSSRDRRIK